MKNSQVEVINTEINNELSNPAVGRTLLATTFKGLNPVSMKQAILEGMIRGFKFRDFLEKNVYAIPFGDTYSLVTSIDYARKRGMKAGIVGKGAPQYVMDGDKIVSCAVTVKRAIGKHIGEYTAEVYFNEYDTGRNLWKTKPRTMIAKVAEMHALRMACPEELSQLYSEEEFEKDGPVQHERMEPYTVARITPPEDDEAQGKRAFKELSPAEQEVVEEETSPFPVEEKKSTVMWPARAKALRLKIAKLLREKAKFVTLGKGEKEVSDKVFDLTGMMFNEENYEVIIEELEKLD